MDASSTANSEALSSSPTMPDRGEWAEEIVEPRSSSDMERLFRRRVGFVPQLVSYINPHPWVHRAVLFLVDPRLQVLDEDLCMQICFVVARDHACRYCYGSLRAFLRVAGYSESELDRLEDELYLRGSRGAEREALRLALNISKGRLQHDDAVDALRETGYGDMAIREIAGSALLDTITTRVATMLAVPIDVRLEEATAPWYFDLLQPIAQTVLAGWQRLGTSSEPPLSAEDTEGAFAPWLLRLRGTNVGRVLHDLTNRWLRTEYALPLRTKLLILAVVARALSQEDLNDRVSELLTSECGLSTKTIEAAVKHLRDDAISDQEVRLLQLARASVRYDPQRLQPTVRKQAQDLSRDKTIDAVATLGLSNALARLCTLDPLDP